MMVAIIIICQLASGVCNEIPAQVRKDLCGQEWRSDLSIDAKHTIAQTATIRCQK